MRRVLMLAILAVVMVGCTRVNPGYVGVEVNQWGDGKGVSPEPVPMGYVFYNPLRTDIHEFPDFKQRVVWQRDEEADESLTFRSGENSTINVDVGLQLHFQTDKIPAIYLEYRRDAEQLIDGPVRDIVRDTFQDVAGQMKTFDILGPRTNELTDQVQKILTSRLPGMTIENVTIIGRPRVDQTVEAAINSVIEQQQRAAAAEAKVRETKAIAAQQIEAAEGYAQSKIKQANADAEALRIMAEAVATHGDKVVVLEAIKKWNGSYPQVVTGSGGSLPIFLPSVK